MTCFTSKLSVLEQQVVRLKEQNASLKLQLLYSKYDFLELHWYQVEGHKCNFDDLGGNARAAVERWQSWPANIIREIKQLKNAQPPTNI